MFINIFYKSLKSIFFFNEQLVISSLKTLDMTIGVDSIVVLTKSGRMAEIISNERPEYPIFAFTNNELSTNKLHLSWGVVPNTIKFDAKNYEKTIQEALKQVKAFKKYKAKKCLLVSYSVVDGKEYPLISIRDVK